MVPECITMKETGNRGKEIEKNTVFSAASPYGCISS
jgi:hypothetical protein